MGTLGNYFFAVTATDYFYALSVAKGRKLAKPSTLQIFSIITVDNRAKLFQLKIFQSNLFYMEQKCQNKIQLQSNTRWDRLTVFR